MKNIITLFLCICSFFVINAQTTIILPIDSKDGKDAIIHGLSSEENINYGNNPQLPATAWTFDGIPGVVRSVLGFDLSSIPSNAIINSAQLSLFAIDSTQGMGPHSTLSGSNECWLERITSSWDESTVTWNTQPTTTSQNRITLAASTSETENYLDMDVTLLVQDMIANPSSSDGFMLKLKNESYFRRMNFCSSDHINRALHPKLVIIYTQPDPIDTCLTIQNDGLFGKDALLHGLVSEVNKNFGSSAELPANAWTFSGVPGVVRSVLEFDLTAIPTNTIISSAKLSLYAIDNLDGMDQHSTLSGSNECWLEKITSSWDESTVTWNTQPTTSAENRISIASSTSETENYLNMDVTSIVQGMIENPSANFGFMLKLKNENFYRRMNFCSSDHLIPQYRPKLEICYSISEEVNEIKDTENSILIFPNPATDFITINVSVNLIGSPYKIIDQLGRTVMNGKLTFESSTININQLSKGMYFLKVGNENQQSLKLIKK